MLFLATILPGCALIAEPDHHGSEALQENHVMVGVWLGSWPTDTNPAIQGFEDKAGVPPDLVDVYLDWQTPFANVSHTLGHIASKGAVAILTWEPQGITTPAILAGTQRLTLRDGRTLPIDDYIAEFAEGTCQSASTAGQPILVRVLHEMNGFWFAWGISWQDAHGARPNTLDNYKHAWIKIHDAFTSRCGDSVRFIWAVNHFGVGPDTGFTQAYPGDAYVDFVGIDGYNWGTNAKWGWQDFDTLFKPGYCALAGLTNKPILIDEISSSERGGDKAQWIRTMYSKIDQYDRIRGFVWFDDEKYEVEIHGSMDWNLDSTPASLSAFSDGAHAIVGERGTPPAARSAPSPCG